MTNEQQILTKLDRLTTELSRLRQEKKQDERWVSAFWIQQLTGWDFRMLDKARKQGLIKYRKNNNNGVEYLLSSVPEEFKKKTA